MSKDYYLFIYKNSKNSNIVNIKIDSAQLNYGYNENNRIIILLFFNETYFYFILFSVFFWIIREETKKNLIELLKRKGILENQNYLS